MDNYIGESLWRTIKSQAKELGIGLQVWGYVGKTRKFGIWVSVTPECL